MSERERRVFSWVVSFSSQKENATRVFFQRTSYIIILNEKNKNVDFKKSRSEGYAVREAATWFINARLIELNEIHGCRAPFEFISCKI